MRTILILTVLLSFCFAASGCVPQFVRDKLKLGKGDKTTETVATEEGPSTVETENLEETEASASAGSIEEVAGEGSGIQYDGWVRQWGQSRVSAVKGVDMDGSGNLYVAGVFNRPADFDPGPGLVELDSVGEQDCFLSKFDSSGNLLWAIAWGGLFNDRVVGLAVDSSGNSYVAGGYRGRADFDPRTGEDKMKVLQAKSPNDVFLCSFDRNGSLRWAWSWGSPRGEVDATGIALDGGENPLVIGWYLGTMDFNPTDDDQRNPAPDVTAGSGSDAYLSRFSSGGAFAWTATWGGDNLDSDQITGTSVTTDGGGNIFVVGRFQGRFELPTTRGLEMNFGWHSSEGLEDAFLYKLDSRGNAQWGRTWGGKASDYALGVAVARNGNIYVTGGIEGTADLDPGHAVAEFVPESMGYAFLSKFNSSGGFQWGRIWGTGLGMAVAADPAGNAIVTGTSRETVDFDPDPAEDAVDRLAGSVFVSKFDPSGDYLWAHAWGRTNYDLGSSLVVDGSGNIFLTGMFRGSVGFTPDGEFDYTTSTSDPDAFLMKLLPDGGW